MLKLLRVIFTPMSENNSHNDSFYIREDMWDGTLFRLVRLENNIIIFNKEHNLPYNIYLSKDNKITQLRFGTKTNIPPSFLVHDDVYTLASAFFVYEGNKTNKIRLFLSDKNDKDLDVCVWYKKASTEININFLKKKSMHREDGPAKIMIMKNSYNEISSIKKYFYIEKKNISESDFFSLTNSTKAKLNCLFTKEENYAEYFSIVSNIVDFISTFKVLELAEKYNISIHH